MDPNIHLTPKDLVQTCFRANSATFQHARHRLVRVQSVSLGLHPRISHCIRKCSIAGIPISFPEMNESLHSLGEACWTAKTDAAFKPSGSHCDSPTFIFFTQSVGYGNAYIVKKDFGETGVAIKLCDWSHCDSRQVKGTQNKCQSSMSFGSGVGTKNAKTPVGPYRTTGPNLLTIKNPFVALTGGLTTNAGHIASGIGFTPCLCPNDFR